MKSKIAIMVWALMALVWLALVTRSAAQGTAFTYQGYLNKAGVSASGVSGVSFALYSSSTNGNLLAGPVTNSSVLFTNGLFTTIVDFGPGIFIGTTNWLELAIQTNANAGFLTLLPRQQMTPEPYAIYAGTAGSVASLSSTNLLGALTLAQLPTSVVTNQSSGLTLAGAFTGNGAGLTNVAYANLTGVPIIPTTNGFVTAAITNGLATTNYVLSQGYVTSVVTNGLATISYVTAQGYLTNANGANAALASNVVSGISLTNATVTGNSSFTGNGAGLTNVPYAALTGVPVIPATNGFVTAAITNGLASTNFVLSQGFVTGAATNGLASISFVMAQGYLTNANGANAALATNVVSGISLTNATVTGNSTFSGNGTGLTNLNLVSANSAGAIAWTTNSGYTNYFFNLVSSATLPVGHYPESLAAADVNGDGKIDLISADSGSGTLTVLTNNGSGVFGSNATLSVGRQPMAVVAAHLNAGTNVDLISANYQDNTLTVLTNNGAGIFGSNATLSVGQGPMAVTAVDVNGDGRVDLIVANYSDNTLTVLTNNSLGIFGSNATLSVGLGPIAVKASDVNGDGQVDIIVANYSDNTLTVLTNNGAGRFSLLATLAVGNAPDAVEVADVNGDGRVDLIVANYSDNTLMVLTNNGAGVFGSNAILAVGMGPVAVVATNLNFDGWVDLISVGKGAGTLTVLTNNQSGGFGLAASPVTGSYPTALVAADVNGDGLVDLVSANQNSYNLTVITNASTVTMVPSSTTPSAGFTGSFSGNAAGLTNVSINALSGGLTVSLPVLVPGGKTNTLVFSNGILVRVQ